MCARTCVHTTGCVFAVCLFSCFNGWVYSMMCLCSLRCMCVCVRARVCVCILFVFSFLFCTFCLVYYIFSVHTPQCNSVFILLVNFATQLKHILPNVLYRICFSLFSLQLPPVSSHIQFAGAESVGICHYVVTVAVN